MRMLARNEEIIMLCILKLGDNAYGVRIREQIHDNVGDWWSFASIYTPLDQLKRKGYVSKLKGEPTSERGGKSKYFYRVTETGKKALLEIQDAQKKFWLGIPRNLLEDRKD